MISFNNPFAPNGPAQPATKLANDGLKALNKTSESEAQHEIADGFLKTIARTGTPEEMAFARTVRAASGKLNLDYQKAAIEEMGLKMLAGGLQGPAGLALAHFGKQAYAHLREAPRGDNAKANAAAARIMQGIEENAHNANAGLLADLGQTLTKKADGVGNVVSQVFDSVINSQAHDKPEVSIARYGLNAGTSGYHHDQERVTGPVLDFLIAHSSSESTRQDAEAARTAGKAGAGYQAASVHRQAFQEVVDANQPFSFAEMAMNPPQPKADESAYLFSRDAHGEARPEEYLSGYRPTPSKTYDHSAAMYEADNPKRGKSLDQILFERDAGIY